MFSKEKTVIKLFVSVVLLSTCCSRTNLTTMINATYAPSNLADGTFEEGQTRNITIWITDAQNPYERLTLVSTNPSVAVVRQPEVQLDYNDTDGISVGSFVVEARFLGRATMTGYAKGSQREGAISKPMEVTVVRAFSKHQTIFAIIVTILMTTTTFMMGTQVKWPIIVSVLKKPVAPIVGFCCQFIIMPMAAYIWGLVLLPGQPYLQLGYFTVGCCPGGKMSNLWCILLDANLDLSVTLTVCSNFLAFAMMPLWLLTLGTNVIAKGTSINIPFANMVGTLLLILIPTTLGMVYAAKSPKGAETVARYIKPVTVVLIVVVGVVAGVLNSYVFALFTWKNILAGMILPWTGFAVAFVVSWSILKLLKTRKRKTTAEEITEKPSAPVSVNIMKDAKTIAIETGIQNAALAILIIIYTLQQPDADLTLVMPVVCMLFTPIPLMIAAVIMYAAKNRNCCRREVKGQKVSNSQTGEGSKTAFGDETSEEKMVNNKASKPWGRADTVTSLANDTTLGSGGRHRGPLHLEPKDLEGNG